MESSGHIRTRIDAVGAAFCALETDEGHVMSRTTCPDGQFWLNLSGSWSVQRAGEARPHQTIAYYAPREACRRVAESSTLSIGLQIKSSLLTELVVEPDRPIHEIPWPVQKLLFQVAQSWRLGELDAEVLITAVAELPLRSQVELTLGSWIAQARDVISDKLLEPLDLRSLALDIGISPCHLSFAFRKKYGLSISAYRRQLRLQRAISLITRDGRSIYEAAAVVGFYDASHFYRVGRRELGMKPAELVELLSEKSRNSVQDIQG